MKLELIVKDAAINFADSWPELKDIMLDAFDKIAAHENIESVDPDDFDVHHADSEETNLFSGSFITSMYGSYLLHDIREEVKLCDEDDVTECTIIFYSLTKLSNDNKTN